MTLLLVALGGAVGAPLRYLLAEGLDRFERPERTGWPLGTALANVAASLVLGACVGASLNGQAFALVGVGFCGALSTYSSFAVQTHEQGVARGSAYAMGTVVAGLAACAVGFWLTSR